MNRDSLSSTSSPTPPLSAFSIVFPIFLSFFSLFPLVPKKLWKALISSFTVAVDDFLTPAVEIEDGGEGDKKYVYY